MHAHLEKTKPNCCLSHNDKAPGSVYLYIRLQFYAQLFLHTMQLSCSFHADITNGRLHIFYSVHSVTKFFIYTLHADHVFAAHTLPHVYVETVATTYHHRNDSDAFILLKMYVDTKLRFTADTTLPRDSNSV